MQELTWAAIEAEEERRSLLRFAERAWSQVEPASPFVMTRLFGVLCELLEAVAHGEILRLAVSLPPRHGKSLLVSVLFTVWVWTWRPETRFLTASYGEDLAERDSVRSRRLIMSPWFQERHGATVRLRADQNTKLRFENTRGGARVAVSVGGAATGEGGDIAILDDVNKLEDARSPAALRTANDWYHGTLSTRLNDQRTGAIIAIGQRVHQGDVFGQMLSEGGWVHHSFAAEYEPAHPHLSPLDWRRVAGELLCPERYGHEEHERLKRQLGSYATASQLQQRPAPEGGGIFKRSWWRFYLPAELPPRFEEIVQSWDLTFGSADGDFVVGQVWGWSASNCYLLHQIRARFDFPQTLEAMLSATSWVNERYPGKRGHLVLVEKSANGNAAIQVLRGKVNVKGITPLGSKVARAAVVSPYVESGCVWLPGAASADGQGCDPALTLPWVQDFVLEAENFPNGVYDDVVDAMSQAVTFLNRPRANVRMLGFH